MFAARSERTMSNPRTRAAIVALRERERRQAAQAEAERRAHESERERRVREREQAVAQMREQLATEKVRLEVELGEAAQRIADLEAELGRRVEIEEFLARAALSPAAAARLSTMRHDEIEIAVARMYQPPLRRIIQRISRATGVAVGDILSHRRTADVSFARQAFFYWAIRLTSNSYPAVGRFAGGKDHTTVLHGVRAYRDKRAAMGRHLRPIAGRG